MLPNRLRNDVDEIIAYETKIAKWLAGQVNEDDERLFAFQKQLSEELAAMSDEQRQEEKFVNLFSLQTGYAVVSAGAFTNVC